MLHTYHIHFGQSENNTLKSFSFDNTTNKFKYRWWASVLQGDLTSMKFRCKLPIYTNSDFIICPL